MCVNIKVNLLINKWLFLKVKKYNSIDIECFFLNKEFM